MDFMTSYLFLYTYGKKSQQTRGLVNCNYFQFFGELIILHVQSILRQDTKTKINALVNFVITILKMPFDR